MLVNICLSKSLNIIGPVTWLVIPMPGTKLMPDRQYGEPRAVILEDISYDLAATKRMHEFRGIRNRQAVIRYVCYDPPAWEGARIDHIPVVVLYGLRGVLARKCKPRQ
jgi:hypothetical protein